MATNPLFQSPSTRLTLVANNTSQQGFEAYSKGLEQQGDAGFKRQLDSQSRTIQASQVPETLPQTRSNELNTPNTSKLADDGLAQARAPEQPSIPDAPKTQSGQPKDLSSPEPGNGIEAAKSADASPGFSGWLSRQAGEYMQQKVAQSGQGVQSGNNETQGSNQTGERGPKPGDGAPQRPESQSTKGGPLQAPSSPQRFDIPNTDKRPNPDWKSSMANNIPKPTIPKIGRPKF